ncbi:hypothetical protein CRG98_025639 [Punica granatum]|uniref:Reverse transcriptase domain-containing protein n=1 Tax=Punica granatum TaxID=22663 RepID=A0A2I0JCH3_PUNGR|nr:hypothetical protein CRG98_025639 [Punica granatum]
MSQMELHRDPLQLQRVEIGHQKKAKPLLAMYPAWGDHDFRKSHEGLVSLYIVPCATASWNVRGLNDPHKQKMVYKFEHDYDLGVFAIIETRVKELNCKKIVDKWKGWYFVDNYQFASNGRLWILVREDLQVQILSKSNQYIHLLLNGPKEVGWLAVTFVYASNDMLERRLLWRDLQALARNISHSWVLMGDFNAVKDIQEVKVVGREVVIDQSMRDFADFLNSAELTDHTSIGCYYTWSNKRQEGFQVRKIDRVLINEKWVQSELPSTVEFLSPGISDHCPAMLKFGEKENAGPKPFKFFHLWTEHPDYMALIGGVWSKTQQGTPMAVLYKKLRDLKMHLREFNRIKFGNVHTQVTVLQHELAQVQSSLLGNDCVSLDSIKKEMDLWVKPLEATDRQEKFLKQKSRVAWLKAGDQNTSFFHKTVKGKNARSTIRALFSGSGVKLERVQEIKDEAINYYQGLLGRKDDCIGGVSTSQLSSILKKKVPNSKLQMLMSPIAEEEIKTALFSMGNDKSPGTDGFTAFFYKHAWQGVSPCCAIKIDLMKAFDSLSWDFILNTMEALGFPPTFLRWIKSCITSPYFSVAINGSLAGYFPGQRGVRQGDSLSPYLFVIAMEVFSHLMDSAAAEGRIGFHPRCKSLQLTHLCFADDLLLFTNGSKESIIAILDVLNTFYHRSGLKLNPDKSEIFTGGINGDSISELMTCSGFKHGTLPVRYLGFPLVSGKFSSKNCEALTERIVKRIKSCSVKHLSYASRVQLINSVLFSMANYWCCHFILPKKVIKLVKQKCRSFLWKGLDKHAGGSKGLSGWLGLLNTLQRVAVFGLYGFLETALGTGEN